jgi:hypothetical protein
MNTVITAPDYDQRPPTMFFQCDGNVVSWVADVISNRFAIPTPGIEFGSSHVWPVYAEYGENTNTSRVGFSYLPPTNVAAA